jgi:hypothetical protein
VEKRKAGRGKALRTIEHGIAMATAVSLLLISFTGAKSWLQKQVSHCDARQSSFTLSRSPFFGCCCFPFPIFFRVEEWKGKIPIYWGDEASCNRKSSPKNMKIFINIAFCVSLSAPFSTFIISIHAIQTPSRKQLRNSTTEKNQIKRRMNGGGEARERETFFHG